MLGCWGAQRLGGAENFFPDAQQPRDAVVGDAGGGAERDQAGGGLGGVLLDGRGRLFVGWCGRGLWSLNGSHEFRPFLH